MKLKFEKLKVWINAMELGERMDSMADKFPKKKSTTYPLKLKEQLTPLH